MARIVLEPPSTSSARRVVLAPGAAVGVTEDMIRDLVHAFYDRVRVEPVLGPIFNSRIRDWDEHLAKLCDFWSAVMLGTRRFNGAPMPAHVRIAEIEPAHFTRWLDLFADTARKVCPPEAAELFEARSRTIGRSFQMGIAHARREMADAALLIDSGKA